MSRSERVSDAELNALLDGELAPEERTAVEARLSEAPDDMRRLRGIGRVNELIRTRYASVLDEPLPESLQRTLDRPPRRRALPWPRLAAACLLLIAGGVAGFVLRGLVAQDPVQRAGFVGDALGAHAVYAAEVRHPVEVAADEEEHLVKWLTKRLGAEVRAPSLVALRFRLMGGRLLPVGDKAAAQFMYEDGSGRRLTLYVRQAGQDDNTAFQFAEHDDLAAFYWIDRPLAYALIGELPRDDLLTVARLTYEQLQ